MRLRIEDLPPRLQAQVRAQLQPPATVKPTRRLVEQTTSRKQPTKTEAAYRREVLDRNPAVSGVAYEALTFRLANGHRYTPDWVYWHDGRLHCVEVKGGYRLGSYQRARMAFDQAAIEWPRFTWIWAEKRNGAWEQKAARNAEARSDDSVQTDVVCDHAFMSCWDKGCQHAVPHRIGVKSLNGMYMGDCTDERNEHVCCVATGSPERIRCVPVRNDDAVEHMDSHNTNMRLEERSAAE